MKKIAIVSLIAASCVFAGNINTGCGLGSIVIKNQDTVAKQVLAVTTNGTLGNQTFGITSGTLGCKKPDALVSNDVFKFVNENMDELAANIANGEGETLDTLANMMKVKDKKSFAMKLQKNFDKIFPNDKVDTAHVIDAINSLA